MAEQPLASALTRRELLNYVWLGSIGVFSANLGGATVLFALPRFKAGEFGGLFAVGAADTLPSTTDAPKAYNDGKFWLVNTAQGILALYRVCTHLGCLYEWQSSTNYFRCPCHGSEFERGGLRRRIPAPRSLDAFNVRVLDAAGNEVTSTRAEAERQGTRYAPVPIQPGQRVVVDTGDLIRAAGPGDGFMG